MISAIKYFGGKFFLAKWVISHFAEHVTYVEPCFGAGNVLLQKPPSSHEVANDIDGIIFNTWLMIRDRAKDLHRLLSKLSHNRQTFEIFKHQTYNAPLMVAVKEIVLTRMSRCADRETYQDSTRLRRGMPESESAWLSALDAIPLLADRMKGVQLFNEPAIKTIEKFNLPTTLVYLDPPYHPSTRVSGGYRCEMTHAQHVELLDYARLCRCKILISGYDCYTYRTMLKDWNVSYKDIVNNASQKAKKESKREMLWMNY